MEYTIPSRLPSPRISIPVYADHDLALVISLPLDNAATGVS